MKNIKHKIVGNLKGNLWEQLELPFYTLGSLVINLCNTSPILKKNQIVVIHDAAVYGFPSNYSFIFKLWYKILFNSSRFNAKKIITDSEFSRTELIKYCQINEKKIIVIYCGSEHIFSIASDNKIMGKNNINKDNFILAVGSLNTNKNFKAIIEALEIIKDIKMDVVIAGGLNSKVFGGKNISSNEKVKYAGYVTDGELRSLYENAACFIFPSFYEGFGLPPLEAMTLGCPVIASNAASIPEVCGDATIYCDPYNSNDLAEKINNVINDKSLRDEMRVNGKKQSEKFSWEKYVFEFIKVIDEVRN